MPEPRENAASSLPAALLLDMDGTLIDSEPYWMQAEQDLVAQHGGTWTHEDALALVGNPLELSAHTLQRAGVRLEVGEIVDFLLTSVAEQVRAHVPWRPGARELLVTARDAGIPCALVTMSYRVLADCLLQVAPHGAFDASVCGDDVTHGKPDPEPYLRAADLLGVDVRACVAIEDSPPGISSALASGAATLGVPAIVPVPSRDGLSRIASLVDLDLPLLRRLVAGETVDLLEVAREVRAPR